MAYNRTKQKIIIKVRKCITYYMQDTDEYNKIEDITFDEVFNDLKPELLKIYKTEKIARIKLIKLITEET